MKFGWLGRAVFGGIVAALALSTPVLAGPTYTFSVSTGSQPSNAGKITITQSGTNSVIVNLELLSGYGLINTGGPHIIFGFDLNVSGGLSISNWTAPPGGVAPNGIFTLDTVGASGFDPILDYSGGNGSSSGYFGVGSTPLEFTLTRTGGLSTSNFISNGTAYFAADLSNGSNTGEQYWAMRSVPEPITLWLFGAGLIGVAVFGFRKKTKKINFGK